MSSLLRMYESETMTDMRDGDRLQKLLDDHDVSRSQIGRDSTPALTPTSVARYIKAMNTGELNDEQWRRLAGGLRKNGIDPDKIRPVKTEPSRVLRTDLLPLLDCFTRKEQLEALRKIIEAEDGHALVLAIVQERLRHL